MAEAKSQLISFPPSSERAVAIVRCPQCNTEAALEAVFCHKCGATISRCAQCGTPRIGDAAFCHKCGATLTLAATPVTGSVPAASNITQPHMPEGAHPLFGQATQMFGLHPIVTFATFAISIMLFGEEAASLMVGWLIAIPVAFVLGVGVVFCQRYMFDDGWGAAIGKAIIVALLTAIPTSIPTVLLVPSGALGIMKAIRDSKEKSRLLSQNAEPIRAAVVSVARQLTGGQMTQTEQRTSSESFAVAQHSPAPTPTAREAIIFQRAPTISAASVAQTSNDDISTRRERMLRYNGLYISKLPVDYGIPVHSYFRFYEDGTVLETSVRGEPTTEVMNWFHKNNDSVSRGTYNASGDSIDFAVTSESGTVDYNGRIVGDELHLHMYSHINGNADDDEWRFVAAP